MSPLNNPLGPAEDVRVCCQSQWGCKAAAKYLVTWTEGYQNSRRLACGRHVSGAIEVGLLRVASLLVEDAP